MRNPSTFCIPQNPEIARYKLPQKCGTSLCKSCKRQPAQLCWTATRNISLNTSGHWFRENKQRLLGAGLALQDQKKTCNSNNSPLWWNKGSGVWGIHRKGWRYWKSLTGLTGKVFLLQSPSIKNEGGDSVVKYNTATEGFKEQINQVNMIKSKANNNFPVNNPKEVNID